MNIERSAAVLAFAAVLAGCATAPPPRAFDDVGALVTERTGGRMHWRRGAAEDEAVEAELQAMLQGELTAEEAVQIALLNNRTLQATYEDLGLAQASLVQAGLLDNPIFEAAAFLPEGGGRADLDLGIVQSFLSVLYRPMRQRIAAAELEAAKLLVTGAVLDLAGEVREAYTRLQADQQIGELLRQVVETTGASVEAARVLRAAGNITELDAARQELFHEQARLALSRAHVELVADRERLIELLGLWGPDTARWSLPDRLPDLPADALDAADLEKRAIEANLDLELYSHRIESAAQRLGLADATALVPDLDLGVVAEREEGEWEVGPAIEYGLPIFDRGQGRRAAAEGELRRARHLYWALAVRVRSEARAAAHLLGTAERRAAQVQRDLVPLSTRILTQTQLQYNAMQLGVFELLRAKQQQIDTGVLYVETLRDYWLARNRLQQILDGRLPGAGAPALTQADAPAMESGGH